MTDNLNMVDYIAKALTDKKKQDVKIFVNDTRGAGMSYAALKLAYNNALLLSKENHGDLVHWREYFKGADHILDEDAINKLKKKK